MWQPKKNDNNRTNNDGAAAASEATPLLLSQKKNKNIIKTTSTVTADETTLDDTLSTSTPPTLPKMDDSNDNRSNNKRSSSRLTTTLQHCLTFLLRMISTFLGYLLALVLMLLVLHLLWMAWSSLIRAFVGGSSTATPEQEPPPDQHSRPLTLLSIRNDDPSLASSYVNALLNPTYERLRGASIVMMDDDDDTKDDADAATTATKTTKPWRLDNGMELIATPSQLQGGDALLLQWTNLDGGEHKKKNKKHHHSSSSSSSQKNHGHDDDLEQNLVIALVCQNNNDNHDHDDDTTTMASMDLTQIQSTSQFLEVATVAQIRATQQATMQALKTNDPARSLWQDSNTATTPMSSWLIPQFPVYQYSTCDFVLYQIVEIIMNNGEIHQAPSIKTTNIDDPNSDSTTETTTTADTPPVELHYITSTTIHLTSATKPTGVHLSATSDATEMRVSFSTGGGGSMGAAAGQPIAVFGTSETSLKQRVSGSSTTYQASDLCAEPANVTEPGKFSPPGMLHTVLLQDLQPNTTYYYKVGLEHGQGVAWSAVYSFTSALPPGDASRFSYLVYGDQGNPENGWGQGCAWTAALVNQQVPSVRAVHHFGDLSYARGAAHQWEIWLDMIEPYAARVPYHVGVGNHEYDYVGDATAGSDVSGESKDPSGPSEYGYHPDWGNYGNDSGGECGVPIAKRFTMPNSTLSNGVFWYSHDFGSVHTIVLSSEHDLAPGSRQYDFLIQDLAAVNRTEMPWVVVELHRPLYESEVKWDQNAVGIAQRYEIENVLYDYGVDLVLSGHYHAYLRTCDGLFRNRCNSGGPLHITVGTAGAHLDHENLYETEWTANYIKETYGYGKITVANATAMLFEFIRAGAEDEDGTGAVLDHVWLLRDR